MEQMRSRCRFILFQHRRKTREDRVIRVNRIRSAVGKFRGHRRLDRRFYLELHFKIDMHIRQRFIEIKLRCDRDTERRRDLYRLFFKHRSFKLRRVRNRLHLHRVHHGIQFSLTRTADKIEGILDLAVRTDIDRLILFSVYLLDHLRIGRLGILHAFAQCFDLDEVKHLADICLIVAGQCGSIAVHRDILHADRNDVLLRRLDVEELSLFQRTD